MTAKEITIKIHAAHPDVESRCVVPVPTGFGRHKSCERPPIAMLGSEFMYFNMCDEHAGGFLLKCLKEELK